MKRSAAGGELEGSFCKTKRLGAHGVGLGPICRPQLRSGRNLDKPRVRFLERREIGDCRKRPVQVMSDTREEALPFFRLLFEPFGGCSVHECAIPLRERLVCNLADQRVMEAELPAAGK